MTRMTNDQERAREQVENVLTSLSNAGLLLDHQAKLRVRQAMQRDPRLTDLLGPVVEIVDRTLVAIDSSKQIISEVWHDGESRRWSPPPPIHGD